MFSGDLFAYPRARQQQTGIDLLICFGRALYDCVLVGGDALLIMRQNRSESSVSRARQQLGEASLGTRQACRHFRLDRVGVRDEFSMDFLVKKFPDTLSLDSSSRSVPWGPT